MFLLPHQYTHQCNNHAHLRLYFEKSVNVTVSGSLSSGKWQEAGVKLGTVKTFSTSGNWTSLNPSGTFTLPAGSTITVYSTMAYDSWRDNFTSSGDRYCGYANITLNVTPA